MFERRAFGILQLTSLSFDLEYFDESLDVKHKNPELFSLEVGKSCWKSFWGGVD